MYKCKYDIEEEGPKKRKIGTALSWKKTQSLFMVDCCESSYLPRLNH